MSSSRICRWRTGCSFRWIFYFSRFNKKNSEEALRLSNKFFDKNRHFVNVKKALCIDNNSITPTKYKKNPLMLPLFVLIYAMRFNQRNKKKIMVMIILKKILTYLLNFLRYKIFQTSKQYRIEICSLVPFTHSLLTRARLIKRALDRTINNIQ